MPIHLADPDCLHPRLTAGSSTTGSSTTISTAAGSPDATPRRVRGLLQRADDPGVLHLIDDVDFDGERCRYRTVEGDAARWIEERPDDDYRACADAVVARLLLLGRERFEDRSVGDTSVGDTSRTDALPNDAFLSDAVVTPEGIIRIEIREIGRRSGRWLPA